MVNSTNHFFATYTHLCSPTIKGDSFPLFFLLLFFFIVFFSLLRVSPLKHSILILLRSKVYYSPPEKDISGSCFTMLSSFGSIENIFFCCGVRVRYTQNTHNKVCAVLLQQNTTYLEFLFLLLKGVRRCAGIEPTYSQL